MIPSYMESDTETPCVRETPTTSVIMCEGFVCMHTINTYLYIRRNLGGEHANTEIYSFTFGTHSARIMDWTYYRDFLGVSSVTSDKRQISVKQSKEPQHVLLFPQSHKSYLHSSSYKLNEICGCN
jgi:hypothetical protein